MAKGKVYLVGAGPGDIGLVTLRAIELISKADVILYDHLIPTEVLKYAKPSTEQISVGKFASKHTLSQDKINDTLIEKAKDHNIVVRLKGGDPFLFGRGGEEAEACIDAKIDFELVPGVTSALSVPSYAGIPPTHRDYTSNVAIVTGHRKNADEQIEIPKAGTVIFLMGVSNINKIIKSLLENGWPEETKIAALEHGTCYDQRVVTGKLNNFLEIVEQAKLRTPAIFIVGKVVELHERLNWFDKKPNVLVLGNYPDKYNRLGNIVHRRIIDCVRIDDYTQADETLGNSLESFDWIAFTSANGVKYFFERLYALGKDARSLASAKIAVIGKTTGERLIQYGLSADLTPETESSTGLLAEFNKIKMVGKKILLPQPEIASAELPDGLLAMKANIVKMPVYKTIDIEPGDIDFDYIDQILFTSGSTVKAFVKYFKKVPKNVKAYCLGPPTLSVAKSFDIDAEILPS